MTPETYPACAQVLALCRALSRRGFLAGTGGNVAVRVDATRFAVTPSAMDYARMTETDICVLDLDTLVPQDDWRSPSVESALHARVLRARPEIACSIHTHQPVASACALLGRPLPVGDTALVRRLGPCVPCVSYAPSGTGWLARGVGAAMQPGVSACLMARHGVLCVGRDAADALATVEALETLCARHLRQSIQRRAEHLPPGALAALNPLLPDEAPTPR